MSAGLQKIIDHLREIRDEVQSVTAKLEQNEAERAERDREAQERWERIQANAEAATERQRSESWQVRQSRELGIPLRGEF